ncbi:AsnC family transcriptional regulator [Candidatus Woesearchaeota archaeon]|nr:AsnC family transcriptional regulator [Candidatus Woesearchaeota archaeon]
MPKNVKSIDKKDKQILYLLNEDGRLSQTRISKLIHLSRELVAYRIKKLIKEKYITGINLVISNRKLNFDTYVITLKLQKITNEVLNEMCSFLKTHKNIKYLDRCSGDWDFIITVAVRDKFGLADFIDELNDKFGDNIAENQILSNTIPMKHERLNFLANMDYRPKWPERYYGKIVLEGKDRRILNTLSNKANINMAKLAQITNLSIDSCTSRFNKLVTTGVITKAKAIINYEKFGLQTYVLLLKINKFSNEKRRKISEFLKTQNNILHAERLLGNYDIKILIIAKDQREFDVQFTDLRAYFKEDLKQYSFSIVLENLRRFSYPKGMW